MALVWVGIGFFTGILLMHFVAAVRISADLAAGPEANSAGEPSTSCLVRSGSRKASRVPAPAVRIAFLHAVPSIDPSALAPQLIGAQADALAEGEPLTERRCPALLRHEALVARTPDD
jgi:hypothetical protein